MRMRVVRQPLPASLLILSLFALSACMRTVRELSLSYGVHAEPIEIPPTTDELVRSLVKRGENAGCEWGGGVERAHCRTTPDKETPLWAPDQPPIYLWSGEEAGAEEAWYVSYNGWVKKQPKSWGNPRHGYRCVRE